MKQLFSTGVSVPFDCAFACQVKDAAEVERALHFAFGDHRINPNREFLKIEAEQPHWCFNGQSPKALYEAVHDGG